MPGGIPVGTLAIGAPRAPPMPAPGGRDRATDDGRWRSADRFRRAQTDAVAEASAMKTVGPGATIGILGGGQLGRMMALAAARLGYCAHVYAPNRAGVRRGASAAYAQGTYDDEAALAAFAAQVAVVA
jgi:phosphoglycerate dehydrogenase-like enzyme